VFVQLEHVVNVHDAVAGQVPRTIFTRVGAVAAVLHEDVCVEVINLAVTVEIPRAWQARAIAPRPSIVRRSAVSV
jgi:hypothetical protein